MKMFTRDVSVDKEKLVKFWKPFAFGSRIFLQDSSIFKWDIFPQFGTCLWKISSNVQENFTTDISLDKEVSIKFWKSTGSGAYSPWRRFAVSEYRGPGCSKLADRPQRNACRQKCHVSCICLSHTNVHGRRQIVAAYSG